MNDFIKPDGNIYLTVIIIAVTVAISYYVFKRQYLQSKLMFNAYAIYHDRELYRLISSGFIHGGAAHLIFNMITLFFFGKIVEVVFDVIYPGFGGIIFVIIYLLAIVISDIPSLVKHKNNPYYNALGASGGVSAIVFLSILVNPTGSISFLLLPIPIPSIVFGIGYIAYSYYMAKHGYDNIGHEAHLTGAFVGIFAAIILIPNVMPRFFNALLGLIS